MDATLGEQGGWEAKLPVVSATLGFIGASFELTGATLKAFGATVGEKLIKAGAALGALSLLVDGIQAAFSAVRAFRQGESKAGWAYAGAAATFVAGAAIGFLTGFSSALTGAFILGPLGWILLLTAIGIGLIWYGLILAQCEANTTKVQDRIIVKSQVATPLVLHQMWAYIRCFMSEGPKNLRDIRPFPRDISFRRCLLEFYPLFDRTEEGARLRANMHAVELVLLTAVGIPLFWLFLPAGIFEYVGQRLAPEPKWPAEIVSRTGLTQRI